ncbi:sugar phosphate isomerase/epimerase family protein, partial [Singulisphaera rosea]
MIGRAFGTMIAYGFEGLELDAELRLARRFGATVLEIFPEWKSEPDPRALRSRLADSGFSIHSAHGCWGGQTIRASRVDLGRPDSRTRRESVDDLKSCIDWLSEAGGTCLVVHPGGLSAPEDTEERRGVLASGLVALGEHARGSEVIVCVENMPPGVYPGSRMAEL